jgi:RimJ/RimL family protein N-acetyltransferase
MSTSIRFATFSDSERLLNWRNCQDVRQFSKSSNLITKEAHFTWLEKRLESLAGEPLFIFEIDGEPAGTARLDFFLEYEKSYVVSILIDPQFHGLGYAKVLLAIVCDYAILELMARKIVANVHIHNEKSKGLFESAGFELVKQYRDFFQYQKNLRP